MKPRTIAACAAGLFAALCAATLGAYAAGLRLNVTPSVPTGIYQTTPLQLERDELVLACLDPAKPAVRIGIDRGYFPVGNCPGGIAPLLKPIAALPGDRVDARPDGLRVNGRLLQGTVARSVDPWGRPLPAAPKTYVVPAGSVLLAVEKPSSFDGRYFGPILIESIQAGSRPVWIF